MTRTVVPAMLVTVLGAVAVLHVVWAFSPWPMKDPLTFTRTIAGTRDGVMPSAPSTVAIALALAIGAVVILMANESIASIGPRWLPVAGTYAVAAALLARGVGGFFMNAGAATEFQRWNTLLYSPLCVVLGALSALVAVAATRR